ncbi:hypothetical protein [Bradyrhizobium sp. SYSU BS000235]
MNKKPDNRPNITVPGRIMFVSEIMAAIVIIIGIGTMMSEDLRPYR